VVILIAVLCGLAVGSFTTVLAARVPAGRTWVSGRSACPRCHAPIAWYDNVPVLSWLVLRRRCRHCSGRISVRYPLIELAVASLFVASAVTWGLSILTLAMWYLACVSVALVAIDIDVRRLPDPLVLPSYVVAAALLIADAVVTGEYGRLPVAGAGFLIMGLAYGLMWFAYPAGLGRGDVTAAALLGLYAGYLGWGVLAVAAIAGPLVGGCVVIVGLATRRLSLKSAVPYGPALVGGAWIGLLGGSQIVAEYLRSVGLE
jgi:leader peptidase (prepilin peptidase)/N-methyltransferase